MSEERRSAPDTLPLSRLEAFSDGVFAIAITLLVLELSVSADAESDLWHAILEERSAYLAYITSFLTIGVFWLMHSAVTNMLRAADGTLFRLNLLVLLFASFLPFPTRLLAEFAGHEEAEQVAVVFYGVALFALDLALTLFARYALERPELVREDVTAERLDAMANRAPSLVFYAAAIGVGFFFPLIGIWLYPVIALYLGIPGHTIRRLIRRH